MRKKLLLVAILLTWLPIMAYAQDQKEALVQELYVKSGMEKQLAQIPLIIQAGFDQAVLADPRLKLPKDLTATIRALVPKAFTPKGLKKTMITELNAKLTVPEIKTVLAWLDTPLGKTCTRLEEDATTRQALTEMQQYAAKLEKSPPPAKHLSLIKELDAAVQGTESNIQIAINTQIAVALATNATLPQEQQKPPDHFVRETEKLRPQVEAAVKSQVLISLLYAYRSLTEAQIKQYVEFLRSPDGAKYMSVAVAALKKALFDGSVKWGKAIGEAVRPEKRESGA